MGSFLLNILLKNLLLKVETPARIAFGGLTFLSVFSYRLMKRSTSELLGVIGVPFCV